MAVTVGSGHTVELKKGKLTLLARDADKKTAYTTTVDLVVPPEGYANVELPLKELLPRKPAGPIEVDVTFVDPTRPGARIQWSRQHSKVHGRESLRLYDFEEQVAYSG